MQLLRRGRIRAPSEIVLQTKLFNSHLYRVVVETDWFSEIPRILCDPILTPALLKEKFDKISGISHSCFKNTAVKKVKMYLSACFEIS